jgi:hypothetical protein
MGYSLLKGFTLSDALPSCVVRLPLPYKNGRSGHRNVRIETDTGRQVAAEAPEQSDASV